MDTVFGGKAPPSWTLALGSRMVVLVFTLLILGVEMLLDRFLIYLVDDFA